MAGRYGYTVQRLQTAVELFAGIGGFRLACDRSSIATVWANDISVASQSVYKDNFGDSNYVLGDIRANLNGIPNHDLLTAGFPCQPFSSAGKKKGIGDPRGSLFQDIVDILYTKQPRFFILENVKRLLTMNSGVDFATILYALNKIGYQVEWRLLNAMDFGLPQNRQRVIFLGTRIDSDSYTPSPRLARDKDATVDISALVHNFRNWKQVESHEAKFSSWGISYFGKFISTELKYFSEKLPPTLLRSVLQSEGEINIQFDFTDSTLDRLQNSIKVDKYYQGVQIVYNQEGGLRMGYTIFGINGVAPTLTASTSRHYERYMVGDRFRRLTNIEYARIQGFPDDHCKSLSIYDQYIAIGNAVPPSMIKWVISTIEREPTEKFYASFNQQPSLFQMEQHA